jgi:hypothetical protein
MRERLALSCDFLIRGGVLFCFRAFPNPKAKVDQRTHWSNFHSENAKIESARAKSRSFGAKNQRVSLISRSEALDQGNLSKNL